MNRSIQWKGREEVATRDERGFIHYTPEELERIPPFEQRTAGTPALGTAGGTLGAVTGAALGTPFGPFGMLAGGAAGAAVGGLTGDQNRRGPTR
jgi:hypothetical protein